MSTLDDTDRRWLEAAVRLARPFVGTTRTEAASGALVVDEALQRVVGRAVTAQEGRHAGETVALAEAKGAARGCTLYVTMEPNGLWGRNPPSTDGIRQAGITRVVIGMMDPDPERRGKGVKRLNDAGMQVIVAEHPAVHALHEAQRTRVRAGRPFIVCTLTVSRDGMIASRDTLARVEAGDMATRWRDALRYSANAVMIGSETLLRDDPDLMPGVGGFEHRNYLRLVAIGQKVPERPYRLLDGVSGFQSAVLAGEDRELTLPPTVEVLRTEVRNGRPDLRRAMAVLLARGVSRLVVEGGARLIESFVAAELVDRFHIITVPIEIGRMGLPATGLGTLEGRLRGAGFSEVQQRLLGPDLLRTYEPEI